MSKPYNVDVALSVLVDISAKPIHDGKDAMNLAYELKQFLLWHEKEAFERGYEAAMNVQIPNEI